MNISAVNPAPALQAANDGGAGLMVMKKALDTVSQDGQNLVSLLQSLPSASPTGLGNNIDIKA